MKENEEKKHLELPDDRPELPKDEDLLKELADLEELPEELKLIIRDPEISENHKKEILRTFVKMSVTETHSGSLPAPRTLGQYNGVVKEGAERIMRMAENQANHRMELEKHVVKGQLFQSQLGQIFGFTLALVAMGLTAWLAISGHTAVAVALATTTVGAVATAFIVGKRVQQKDLAEKS